MSKHAYVQAYPKEFRDKVVELMQAGNRSTGEVAKEFGISADSVRICVQQSERDRAAGRTARAVRSGRNWCACGASTAG